MPPRRRTNRHYPVCRRAVGLWGDGCSTAMALRAIIMQRKVDELAKDLAPAKSPLFLSKYQLISLRRFLNRAIACAEGRCPQYRVSAWYYLKPILEQVDNILKTQKKTKTILAKIKESEVKT